MVTSWHAGAVGMAKSPPKIVLFLDTGTATRGRAAEAEFNAVAGRFGLPWVARCRAAGDSIEPLSSEIAAAGVVVALDQAGLESLLTGSPVAVEFWDGPAPVAERVSGLVARLLGGRVVAEAAPPAPKPAPPKKVHTVRVGRETAGRRGKGVTTVFDLPLNEAGIKELAATLKQKCGTGGTVKDGKIEIQGDNRDRIAAELEQLGYKVKRTGG